MLSVHKDLYRGVIASFDSRIVGQGYIRKTDGAWEGIVARTQEGKPRHQRDGHMQRAAVRTRITKSQVDLQEAFQMAYEPARLERNRATARWPVCPVLRDWYTPACEAKLARRSATVCDSLIMLTYMGRSIACHMERCRS